MENVAYKKSKWINNFRRSHSKRHVGQAAWLPAAPPRDVTSRSDADHATECVRLSSLHVDRPTMRIDLGRRMEVSGVIVTGEKTTNGTCRVSVRRLWFIFLRVAANWLNLEKSRNLKVLRKVGENVILLWCYRV